MKFSLSSLKKSRSMNASEEFKQTVSLIFGPLVKVYLEHMREASYHQAIYELFGVAERPIHFYKVIKEFKLPGAYRLNPQAQADGYKPAKLKYGKILTVREDDAKPNIVGVQVNDNDCYNLTRKQWDSIQHRVKKLD